MQPESEVLEELLREAAAKNEASKDPRRDDLKEKTQEHLAVINGEVKQTAKGVGTPAATFTEAEADEVIYV